MLLEFAIGMPLLYLFAGLLRFEALPDWLVSARVEGRRGPYFLATYIALVATIPVLYFGGIYIRENDVGSSFLVLLAACPLAFGLKYLLLKLAHVQYHD
ncbi:hypothetical protein [Roseobacter sp. CCS2]|uniref:hypothetical protein n=1 Tax=Roseobacter sp. CCS2 TaxID=391593 RepID=UPI0012E9B174|nr:hypothetical protein [Roseobacter sp. CCS2]